MAGSADWRLHKHADYQRVYQSSRKQFSQRMSYFAAPQPAGSGETGARVGITAGKVLGKAVDRNRIKRRMRAAILASFHVLPTSVDVVLHPKRTVLQAEWPSLRDEVQRIFHQISHQISSKTSGKHLTRPAEQFRVPAGDGQGREAAPIPAELPGRVS